MPIQNNATILENIVLVESARQVHETTDRAGVIDFVNSFAMPCLSGWINQENGQNEALNPQRIATLLAAVPIPNSDTFAGLYQTCVTQNADEGPNGALLVALLFRRLGHQVRLWLNDNGGHYPGTIASLQNVSATLAKLDPNGIAPLAVEVDPQDYDGSLANLGNTLQAWCQAKTPVARIGYLDPNRYRPADRNGPETSSPDHRVWLNHAMSNGCPLTVAVHFTGHRNFPLLHQELPQLRNDAATRGFQCSVTFSHRQYTTTVSIRH